MKRDMNLVREILLKIEEIPEEGTAYSSCIEIGNYSKNIINYHCKLMLDHGLIIGVPMKNITSRIPRYEIYSLTWEGHDFLDACRDETRWQKAQGLFSAVGSVSFDVMKSTLSTLGSDAIKSLLLR